MKNHAKQLILASVCLAVLAVSVIFAVYFSTTLSAQQCQAYCLANTQRNATVFGVLKDGRYAEKDYIYRIAVNGDAGKAQEIFVFRQKPLGILNFNRYEFVTSSTALDSSANTAGVGCIRFITRNDKNEREKGYTLLYYGVRDESDIAQYEYTLTTREGSNVYRGNVSKADGFWYVKFYNVGAFDLNEVTKAQISDVHFLDSNGNTVAVF